MFNKKNTFLNQKNYVASKTILHTKLGPNLHTCKLGRSSIAATVQQLYLMRLKHKQCYQPRPNKQRCKLNKSRIQ